MSTKFSNGCALGCDACDGTSRGPLPGKRNGSTWRGCSKRDASGEWMATCNLCPEAHAKATICDPKLRTINSDAPCGGSTDYYYYSPWRAPYAPPSPCLNTRSAPGRRSRACLPLIEAPRQFSTVVAGLADMLHPPCQGRPPLAACTSTRLTQSSVTTVVRPLKLRRPVLCGRQARITK